MSDRPANTLSLVADVGGTNTRVALAEGDSLIEGSIRRYRNAEHYALEAVLKTYVEEEGGVDCAGAAVAIAGPVRDGRGELTNLAWSIDRETLAQATKAEKVAVLNDLQAQGHAIGRIESDNLRQVIAGSAEEPHARSAKLVVGVGTGFNACPVFDSETVRLVPPAEAGHVILPVRNERDLRLAKFVESIHGFPSVEDVLSGRGLENVYEWVTTERDARQKRDAARIMEMCGEGDAAAEEAVSQFVRTLGSVVGNLALTFLPFGGIYLIGGVTRAMAPHFDTYGFAAAFRDKGRFGKFMDAFAVSIVEDDFAALTGLAAHLNALD